MKIFCDQNSRVGTYGPEKSTCRDELLSYEFRDQGSVSWLRHFLLS